MIFAAQNAKQADVAELADALDSGSSARKGVEVQILSSALTLLTRTWLNSLGSFLVLRDVGLVTLGDDEVGRRRFRGITTRAVVQTRRCYRVSVGPIPGS